MGLRTIKLVAGILLTVSGAIQVSMLDMSMFGWASVAVGLLLVAQFFWLGRKA